MKLKAFDTKLTILQTALRQVRHLGYEAVSIGGLAKEVGMSKSGIFAHFKSKENLHIMVIDHGVVEFTKEVFRPAFNKERGLERLRAFLDNWIEYICAEQNGGCPLLGASVEFDDRPGVVKERVAYHLENLKDFIEKAIQMTINTGEFKKDTDCKHLAFEIYSLIIGFHIYQRTVGTSDTKKFIKKSFKNIIENNRA